jgi:NAD(P)-dependent dehydrogenase (short-subunit alcohol dehydrogenase family)
VSVALVTGAGRGMGAALAQALAADGFHMAVHYHASRDGADLTCAAIRAEGGQAEAFGANLASDAGAEGLAAAIEGRFGGLDVLVNNAGLYQDKLGLELSEREWFEGLDTTVSAVFFATRACLPLLRRSARGRIVNIGDSSADRPGARDLAWSYHVGKTGVWMLTRSLAASEAVHGIGVNMVSPGLLENSIGDLSAERIPAKRLGTFDDVYAAVRFLAREAPAYLSGSNLLVSGGWNLR